MPGLNVTTPTYDEIQQTMQELEGSSDNATYVDVTPMDAPAPTPTSD